MAYSLNSKKYKNVSAAQALYAEAGSLFPGTLNLLVGGRINLTEVRVQFIVSAPKWRGFVMLTKMIASTGSMRSVLLSLVTLMMLWIELSLALILNRRFCGRGFMRALLLVPHALSTVTVTFLWR